MAPSHSDYDAFAWFYNRYWGTFAQNAMPIFDELVLSTLPPGAEILDLCCGSGQLAALLTERGYRVTGVDQSTAMLEYARENAPEAAFMRADARQLTLNQAFDAAFCTFDSLNHLMSREELGQAVGAVLAHLRPGGHFLFDLNTDETYRENWRGSFAIIEDDHLCAAKSTYDRDQRLASMTVATFRLHEGSWHRQDVAFEQRCYDVEDVSKLLAEQGFQQVTAYRGSDFPAARMSAGRAFFHARKGS